MNRHIYPLIAILIALGAWFFPINGNVQTKEVLAVKPKTDAKLVVSGINLKVFVKKGLKPYSGGVIDGLNLSSTIYISKEQAIHIEAKGSNIKIIVDSDIIENLNVIKSGLNIDIIES